MSGAEGWFPLHVALELLERHARDGRHAERLELATRLLELHPNSPALQVHRVLALLELRGFEAARSVLRELTRPWLASGDGLPLEHLELLRTLAARAVPTAAEPDFASEILEVSPVLPSGLYRVTFVSGGATQMSAKILGRVYGVRVGAPPRVVH